MKLSKIYSNDDRFNVVKFKDGLNIIVGKITYKTDNTKDSHNLGKSTLIELIDFLLLKEITKDHFLKKDIFNNHIFFLELKLNCGKFLTIKRSVRRNTRIYMKVHNDEDQNFINETSWTYSDLPLTTKDPDKNPKKILNDFLSFDVLKKYNYRKTVNYFFRTQHDYSNIFQLNKNSRSRDDIWKPVLFELLGFDSTNMVGKYKLESEIESKNNYLAGLLEESGIDIKDKEKIIYELQLKKDKYDSLEKWINKFDFYIEEVEINRTLVEKIEKNISILNTFRYNLDYEITNINESLNQERNNSISDLLDIYKSVEINFPDQLKKSYQELLEFNKKVFEERKIYLIKSLEDKKQERENVEEQLKRLNFDRMQALEELQESDTFNKLKEKQKTLLNIEKEIYELEKYLEDIESIEKDISEIASIKVEKEKFMQKLEQQTDEKTPVFIKIQEHFNKYFNLIVNKSAEIDLAINDSGNVEFKEKVMGDNNIETNEGDGNSYKKMLCVVFDLALAVSYIDKSFYKVVYHDGSLESLDPRKKNQYIKLIKNLVEQNNFQYIFTALEYDLLEVMGLIKEYICLELSDEDDDSGRLFGFKF